MTTAQFRQPSEFRIFLANLRLEACLTLLSGKCVRWLHFSGVQTIIPVMTGCHDIIGRNLLFAFHQDFSCTGGPAENSNQSQLLLRHIFRLSRRLRSCTLSAFVAIPALARFGRTGSTFWSICFMRTLTFVSIATVATVTCGVPSGFCRTFFEFFLGNTSLRIFLDGNIASQEFFNAAKFRIILF